MNSSTGYSKSGLTFIAAIAVLLISNTTSWAQAPERPAPKSYDLILESEKPARKFIFERPGSKYQTFLNFSGQPVNKKRSDRLQLPSPKPPAFQWPHTIEKEHYRIPRDPRNLFR